MLGIIYLELVWDFFAEVRKGVIADDAKTKISTKRTKELHGMPSKLKTRWRLTYSTKRYEYLRLL